MDTGFAVNGTRQPSKPVALTLITLVWLMALLLPTKLAAAPSAAEYGLLLNLSGKQRMLSQKMAKEVMLIALGVAPFDNAENLSYSSALFHSTLDRLRKHKPWQPKSSANMRRIQQRLQQVEQQWLQLLPLLETVMIKHRAPALQLQQIAEHANNLTELMDVAVNVYEADADITSLRNMPGLARSINLAGKQRMLTQRISTEFLLIALDVETAKNRQRLKQNIELFEQTLTGLAEGDAELKLAGTQRAEILTQLVEADRHWQRFKPLVEAALNQRPGPQQIQALADANLPLLREVNIAVKLFELEAKF